MGNRAGIFAATLSTQLFNTDYGSIEVHCHTNAPAPNAFIGVSTGQVVVMCVFGLLMSQSISQVALLPLGCPACKLICQAAPCQNLEQAITGPMDQRFIPDCCASGSALAASSLDLVLQSELDICQQQATWITHLGQVVLRCHYMARHLGPPHLGLVANLCLQRILRLSKRHAMPKNEVAASPGF